MDIYNAQLLHAWTKQWWWKQQINEKRKIAVQNIMKRVANHKNFPIKIIESTHNTRIHVSSIDTKPQTTKHKFKPRQIVWKESTFDVFIPICLKFVWWGGKRGSLSIAKVKISKNPICINWHDNEEEEEEEVLGA
jgi:hypothetical protein